MQQVFFVKDERLKTADVFFNRYGSASVSGLPKYAQLREAIDAAITDGFWKPGDQLPNEALLASSKRYSLGTVQRALKELSKEGRISRRHGLGSFVLEMNKAMDRPNHLRFIDTDENTLDVFPKIIGRHPVENEGPWSNILKADIRSLIRIDRLFHIGSELMTYSRFYIDVSKYTVFATQNIDSIQADNFKTILRKEYNINISKSDNRLRVQPFNEISHIFDTNLEMVGAILEFTGISDKNIPIYYQEVFIPPSQNKLILSDQLI